MSRAPIPGKRLFPQTLTIKSSDHAPMRRQGAEIPVPLSIEANSTHTRISLEGSADIGCAAELKPLLLEALKSGGEVRVAVGEAGGMDVAILQLLWAAGCAAREMGGSLTVEAGSAMRAFLQEAGMETVPFRLAGDEGAAG